MAIVLLLVTTRILEQFVLYFEIENMDLGKYEIWKTMSFNECFLFFTISSLGVSGNMFFVMFIEN